LRGDIYEYPILVRESGYGEWITKEIPRFAFASTMLAMTYLVSDTRDEFGYKDTKTINPLMADWVEISNYSPVIIDFAGMSEHKLREYSAEIGRRDVGGNSYTFASPYGLVYYDNMGPYSVTQLEQLSITSRELFDADVKYGDWN